MITAEKQNILWQFKKLQEINYLLAVIKSTNKERPLKYNFFVVGKPCSSMLPTKLQGKVWVSSTLEHGVARSSVHLHSSVKGCSSMPWSELLKLLGLTYARAWQPTLDRSEAMEKKIKTSLWPQKERILSFSLTRDNKKVRFLSLWFWFP